MFICVCNAVSDKRIQHAVEAGEVITLRDLTRELGVGTCCGKCVPSARAVLTQALAQRQTRPPVQAPAYAVAIPA